MQDLHEPIASLAVSPPARQRPEIPPVVAAESVTKVLLSVGKGIHEVNALRIGQKELWLVPQWIRRLEPGQLSRPAWMIRMDVLRHTRMGDLLVLVDPMPVRVFKGKCSEGYEMQFGPDILVSLPRQVAAGA